MAVGLHGYSDHHEMSSVDRLRLRLTWVASLPLPEAREDEERVDIVGSYMLQRELAKRQGIHLWPSMHGDSNYHIHAH